MGTSRNWWQHKTYDVTRVVVRLVASVMFRWRYAGAEHFPTSGGAVICANHQSLLDPPLIGATCLRRMNYLARENLFHSRWFGRLIRWYDAIPVRRDGLGIAGLKETLTRLRRGELVLIFPEGTRTSDGDVAELKPGFCVLARRAAVPIIPVALDGAYQAWPRGAWPRLSRIRIRIGKPIGTDEIAQLSDEQLMALVAERIGDCHRACREWRSSSVREKSIQKQLGTPINLDCRSSQAPDCDGSP